MKENKILFLALLLLLPVFTVDKTVLTWIRGLITGNLHIRTVDDAVNPLIRFASHGATLITASLGLYLFAGSFSRRLCDAGKTLLIGLCSAGVAVQIIKHLFGRARPRITYDSIFIGPSIQKGYDSFPSGHTTLAFCLAYILSRYYPKFRAVFYAFAVVVGMDRLDGLSHFPSDVIAGAVLGTLVAKLLMRKFVEDPARELSEIKPA